MNAMNMPGFTAEASLYPTNERYRAEATNEASSTHVVAQFPVGLCNKAAYYCNRGYQKWCDVLDRVCLPDD
jgi:hypothetical protein